MRVTASAACATAYFRNMEVPSLTDHIKYWTETIKSLGYRNGMLTRFEILACPPHSHSAGPHSDLPASSSRSHQIVTATSSE